MLKTWEVSDKDSLDLGSIFSVPVVLPTLQEIGLSGDEFSMSDSPWIHVDGVDHSYHQTHSPDLCQDDGKSNMKVELEENPALTEGLCEVMLIEGTLTMEDLQTFGPLEMDIRQNKKCKYGKDGRVLHIQRQHGTLDLDLIYTGVVASGKIIRIRPIRKNAPWLPVDQVCRKHANRRDNSNLLKPNLKAHVLRPEEGFEGEYIGGVNPSLVWPLLSERKRIKLFFKCNDSCGTSSERTDRDRILEMERDLLLVATVEAANGEVLARQSIPVWPKAQVVHRELDKEVRRRPKGGAAQKQAKGRLSRNDLERIGRRLISLSSGPDPPIVVGRTTLTTLLSSCDK